MRSLTGPPWLSALLVLASAFSAPGQTRLSEAAMDDWRGDAPGVMRKLVIGDLPAPGASSALPAGIVGRPEGAELHTLPGFTVAAFAKVPHARQIRVAPNGDVFIAQSDL
jgi:hypothetical protein